ncbi:MAG: ABC transporter substrate-binding protein [Candidatus Marinimicrobia bacterium]|nr:ABC transporter substrate-binding protein [Candidatus Neomarinimicrobiota bacterium]MDD5582703.1 ABC transporter substrate-binding protein [Candidatus Neomarinimicrobiota bacterium]
MKHVKYLMVSFLILFLCLAFSACSKLEKPTIVSCSSTMTEIIYEIGAGDQVLGVTSFCFFPEQVIKDKEIGRVKVIGDFVHINFGLIDSIKPDLIFTDTNMQRKIADSLRVMGYAVYHFEPAKLEDVYDCITKIGEVTENGKKAQKMVDSMKKEMDNIRAISSQREPVKVYMEINHMGPWTFGSESPLDGMIEAAGGINIFGDTATGVFITSNAEIVQRNPDIILSPIWLDAELGGWTGITPLREIYTRPDFEKTNAVIRSRVLYYDSALMKHFGPRQVVATQKLAYLLHPEYFESPKGTIPWELGWIK